LRFDVGQSPREQIAVPLILAQLQIFLDARARKHQHFPAAARVHLGGRHRLAMFPAALGLRILYLTFNPFAFPALCHAEILCRQGGSPVLYFEMFR
jgi:hypothetical protein